MSDNKERIERVGVEATRCSQRQRRQRVSERDSLVCLSTTTQAPRVANDAVIKHFVDFAENSDESLEARELSKSRQTTSNVKNTTCHTTTQLLQKSTKMLTGNTPRKFIS